MQSHNTGFVVRVCCISKHLKDYFSVACTSCILFLLSVLNMRVSRWCWIGLLPSHDLRVLFHGDSFITQNTMYSVRTIRCHGFGDKLCPYDFIRDSCLVTSNEDTCWTVGLVEEVAVNSEQGATHDTASGGGHSCHLWIRHVANITAVKISDAEEGLMFSFSFSPTYLQMSEPSRVCLYQKPCIDSCLASSWKVKKHIYVSMSLQ